MKLESLFNSPYDVKRNLVAREDVIKYIAQQTHMYNEFPEAVASLMSAVRYIQKSNSSPDPFAFELSKLYDFCTQAIDMSVNIMDDERRVNARTRLFSFAADFAEMLFRTSKIPEWAVKRFKLLKKSVLYENNPRNKYFKLSFLSDASKNLYFLTRNDEKKFDPEYVLEWFRSSKEASEIGLHHGFNKKLTAYMTSFISHPASIMYGMDRNPEWLNEGYQSALTGSDLCKEYSINNSMEALKDAGSFAVKLHKHFSESDDWNEKAKEHYQTILDFFKNDKVHKNAPLVQRVEFLMSKI